GLSSGRRQEETAAEKRERKISAVRELRSKFNVSDLVKLTGLPRSSFYYSESHPKQDMHKEERELVHQIYHANKGRYGYRRITLEFRNRGKSTNHKVIQKLMHEEHIVCKVRQHKYNSYKGQVGKIAPNLLKRDFSTTKSNEKWVTDVTQFNVFGTKLYLSPILDLHDQSLVSWNISETPNYAQTVDMLDKAFEKIPDGTNLILHSDQGWQYQMYDYQRRLKKKGIRQSMSRKGNCLDNSVMENFFGLLKSELLYLQTFESVEQFKRELVEYLEWYNEKRIKVKLKGLTPLQFRNQSLKSA
ncbi:IS3 family transposase, partial [Treponema sp.]|uniref:IS3 family transposase n=1 Tax=Treponema sp. TaxID=166 RepID=UPI00388E17BC